MTLNFTTLCKGAHALCNVKYPSGKYRGRWTCNKCPVKCKHMTGNKHECAIYLEHLWPSALAIPTVTSPNCSSCAVAEKALSFASTCKQSVEAVRFRPRTCNLASGLSCQAVTYKTCIQVPVATPKWFGLLGRASRRGNLCPCQRSCGTRTVSIQPWQAQS